MVLYLLLRKVVSVWVKPGIIVLVASRLWRWLYEARSQAYRARPKM